ncbi:MAG TPA: MutH/Sau3AI family endonuclease [Gemmatimonadaceae bacterium]
MPSILGGRQLAAEEAELLSRALALRGRPVGAAGLRRKGKIGTLVERALGATGGSAATWDFPELRVELKTIPVDARTGRPRESTFVCAVSLADADRAEWAGSWVRSKLSRVLWVPVIVDADGAGVIGEARLWSPTPEQDGVLAGDFEEIMGRVGVGDVEGVTARLGRWLQLRPKAAHGRVRTLVPAAEGASVATVPRGFYLRARFTAAILRDPAAMP